MKVVNMTIMARINLIIYAFLIGIISNRAFYKKVRLHSKTNIEKIYFNTVYYTTGLRNTVIILGVIYFLFFFIPHKMGA